MVDIRQLTPDDWQVWREVRLRALAEAPHAFGARLADWSGSRDREQRWRHRLEEVPANFIAYFDSRPAGQISGAFSQTPHHVALISMWVAPEARGVGVGDALIQAVEDWADRTGAVSVALSVKLHNDPATALYERHGFVRTNNPVRDGEFEMVKLVGGRD